MTVGQQIQIIQQIGQGGGVVRIAYDMPGAAQTSVFLNGRRMSHVIWADDTGDADGEVCRYVTTDQGALFIINGELERETLRGVVKITQSQALAGVGGVKSLQALET